MDDTSNRQGAATKTEIVIVFVAVSAIIGLSYFTAHYAAANTPADPVFRHVVRPESTKPLSKTEYLYVRSYSNSSHGWPWVHRSCPPTSKGRGS